MSEPISLQFRMGNAQSPSSPWGRDELDVYGDGSLVYRNQRGTTSSTVKAQMSDDAATRLLAAFNETTFPDSPDAQVQGGGSACEVIAGGHTVLLDYHTGMDSPTWGPFIKILTTWTGILRQPVAKRPPSDDLLMVTDA